MKNIILAFFIIFNFSGSLLAQGYFVHTAGEYFPENIFKTNIQTGLQEYSGTYTAASETYESAYTYIVSPNGDFIDLTIISGACMDGENWQFDTVYFKNISVQNGTFRIDNSQIGFGGFDNTNFRFVKATLKYGGKTVNTEGIIMEEYKMFAEIEK